MKEEAILKINKMGRAAAIVSKIAYVFAIMAFIIFMAGTIALFCLPKSLLSCELSSNADVSIDISGLKNGTMEWSKEQQEELQNGMEHAISDNEITSYAIDSHVLTIQSSIDRITITLPELIYTFLFCILEIGLALLNIIFVHRLAKAFTGCASPFEENVIAKMQHLAVSLIPWALLSESADRAFSHMMGRGDYNPFVLNLAPVCMVLIIFMLTYIFKYGARLQQESDETL